MKRIYYGLAALAAATLVGQPVAAQVTRHLDMLPSLSTQGLTDLNNVILFRSAHAGAQAFDGQVEPDLYVVGPGDEIEINIWSPSARSFLLTITPEGTLLIPAVGELAVSALTLTDARSHIIEACERAFPGSDISATLIQARRVRVHVSGHVGVPGTYELYASQRVADAVARAGDILPRSGSARNVVRTSSERTAVLDLLEFYSQGDLSNNPYLEGGDHIRIPPREPMEDQLQVAGAVLQPGFIEFRPGDRVSNVIRYAYGFQPRADLSQIVVTRTDPATGRPSTFYASARVDRGLWTIENDMTLTRGDRVFVSFLPRAGRIATVALYGEVVRPGHYAVVEDSTMLSELIAAAGGLTDRASPHETKFLRPAYESQIAGDSIPPLISTRLDDLLAGDRSFDVPLKNRDSIHIPPQSLGVQVLGRVRRPGILTYVEDQSVSRYIDRAGGYSVQADKGGVRVVRAVSGAVEKPNRDHPPQPGDQIIIPEQTKTTTLQRMRDVLTVLGAVATTYLVVEKITE